MPKTLTKADIISAIQTANGYSLKQATDITETLLEITKRTLESGEDVLVSGFGKFQVKNKRERKGRNPATGDDMILPARRVIAFKCAGRLRERINAGLSTDRLDELYRIDIETRNTPIRMAISV